MPNNVNTGGISFLGLLTLILVTLKLTGMITWSWWIILAPAILSFCIWLMIIAATVALIIAVLICDYYESRR